VRLRPEVFPGSRHLLRIRIHKSRTPLLRFPSALQHRPLPARPAPAHPPQRAGEAASSPGVSCPSALAARRSYEEPQGSPSPRTCVFRLSQPLDALLPAVPRPSVSPGWHPWDSPFRDMLLAPGGLASRPARPCMPFHFRMAAAEAAHRSPPRKLRLPGFHPGIESGPSAPPAGEGRRLPAAPLMGFRPLRLTHLDVGHGFPDPPPTSPSIPPALPRDMRDGEQTRPAPRSLYPPRPGHPPHGARPPLRASYTSSLSRSHPRSTGSFFR
jgi:hypothetical protein